MDLIQRILGRALDGLALVGTAVELLIYVVLIGLGILFFILILNYRDDLKFKRIVYSRINEIDELSLTKLKIFMPTMLSLMGFVPVHEEDDQDQSVDDQEQTVQEPEDTKVGHETGEPGHQESEKQQDVKTPENELKQQDRVKVSADAFVKNNGEKYAVFVEKKEHGINPRVFIRLEKAMSDHNCNRGMIINNGFFTRDELEQGALRSIEMWDRDRIIKELLHLQGKEDFKDQPIYFYVNDFFKWLVKG